MNLNLNEDTLKQIERLADLLNKKSLETIEFSHGASSVRLTSHGVAPAAAPNMEEFVYENDIQEEHNVVKSNNNTDNQNSDMSNFDDVKSPMIGTVYLAPAPGKKPFISEGSTIKEGDTLFIIEAMKVMNEVKATFSGTVKSILIKDKDEVQFGQILAKVAR